MVALPRLLTAAAWKSRIVQELRGDERLVAWLDLAWDGNVHYANRPRVRYLATKYDAVDFLLGILDEEPSVPVEGDQASRETDRRANLIAVRASLTAQLKTVRVSRVGVVQPGTLGTIIPSPALQPAPTVFGDAMDTTYGGDPNKRPWPVQAP